MMHCYFFLFLSFPLLFPPLVDVNFRVSSEDWLGTAVFDDTLSLNKHLGQVFERVIGRLDHKNLNLDPFSLSLSFSFSLSIICFYSLSK